MTNETPLTSEQIRAARKAWRIGETPVPLAPDDALKLITLVDEQQATIAKLEAISAEQQETIAKLETVIAEGDQQATIDELRSEVEALRGQVEDMQTIQDETQKALDVCTAERDELQTKLDGLA